MHILPIKGVRMKKDPARCAWELFEKTGKVSYYMLYKKLKKRD